MKNDYETRPSILVIDLRAPGDSAFAQSVIDYDPLDPTFEALPLKAALNKNLPKSNYGNVKLVVFIEDAAKPRDQEIIDRIMKVFSNTDRWMTYKTWKDSHGKKSTSEELFLGQKNVGNVQSEGGVSNEFEVLNLITQATGSAQVQHYYYNFQVAEDEFKELFMAKRDNSASYEEKLESFIEKYAMKLGRSAFQDNLIPRLLHSLKNESPRVQQQAKNILSQINRDYYTSFTTESKKAGIPQVFKSASSKFTKDKSPPDNEEDYGKSPKK